MTEEELVILALLLGKYIRENPNCDDETVEALRFDLMERVKETEPEDLKPEEIGL